MRYIAPRTGRGAHARRLQALEQLAQESDHTITLTESNSKPHRSTHQTYVLDTPIGPIRLYGSEIEPFLLGYYFATAQDDEVEKLAPTMTEIQKMATESVASMGHETSEELAKARDEWRQKVRQAKGRP